MTPICDVARTIYCYLVNAKQQEDQRWLTELHRATPSWLEGIMNSSDRKVQKSTSSNDIANMLRELQKLRAKVSRAELAAAGRHTKDAGPISVDKLGRRKSGDRNRTH